MRTSPEILSKHDEECLSQPQSTSARLGLSQMVFLVKFIHKKRNTKSHTDKICGGLTKENEPWVRGRESGNLWQLGQVNLRQFTIFFFNLWQSAGQSLTIREKDLRFPSIVKDWPTNCQRLSNSRPCAHDSFSSFTSCLRYIKDSLQGKTIHFLYVAMCHRIR